MTDPTGRVYRLSPNGKLDCLVDNGASPNGLALNPEETVYFKVYRRLMTGALCRDDQRQFSVAPAIACGRWDVQSGEVLCVSGHQRALISVYSFGIAGPDGLTVDTEGNLFICHPSLCCIFVVDKHGLPLARIVPPPGHGTSVTNVIFGSTSGDAKRLYFTDSTVGRVCYLDWEHAGATPVRATRA